MKRVPFVVRRNRVRAALEWLKLNNVLYRDISISERNLRSYVDGAIPTIITWSREEGNNPIESRAANDNEAVVGAESGPCPFTVNGVAFDAINPENLVSIKAVAANHMLTGKALAVPHLSTPDTLWHNPDLFPCMFPWLFPYGLGGICNTAIKGRLSEHAHKKHLMLYYDKRFQRDKYFPLMAFNQEQITKGSMAGVFLSSKSKFQYLVDLLLGIDRTVFGRLAERLQSDPGARPESEEEWACFRVLSQLDMVNGHVPGSVASKRYERNELWSLLSYLGAPSWFITFSPSDTRHPLCLYLAGPDLPFDERRISLLHRDAKRSLISNNPVASARFFHFVVNLFIQEVLRWGKTEPGLFGETSAFYGTVEQQGRLTLHLHVLIWIRWALSPEEIRRRLLDPDSDFQIRMIQYLDSCHQGCLVESDLEAATLERARRTEQDPTYMSPVNLFPSPISDGDGHKVFNATVNDILSRTNAHDCDDRCWRNRTVKICKSRFPRALVAQTHVDDTGYIHVRHREPRMNTVNVALTYLLRCNTDVTCLLSGTAIKAVIAYATDYITKVGLKTPSMFQLIRTQLDRSDALIDGTGDRREKGRKLVVGIINSFTSKSEIGGPMAASYLLDLPDHYKSHMFKVFYWRGFVAEVLSAFDDQRVLAEAGVASQADYSVVVNRDITEASDRVKVIAVSPVQDYMFRPKEHEPYCLYDWIRLYMKARRGPSPGHNTATVLGSKSLGLGEGVADTRRYRFLSGHAQAGTHSVWLDNSRADFAPNFVGGALPRRDTGDREYYSCTMLTFFRPWRSGRDLKAAQASWEDEFNRHRFSERQAEVMGHFNLRYECLDARDDFSRLRNAGGGPDTQENANLERAREDDDGEDYRDGPNGVNEADLDELCSVALGRAHLRRSRLGQDITRVLQLRGWTAPAVGSRSYQCAAMYSTSCRSRDVWASRLEAARVTRDTAVQSVGAAQDAPAQGIGGQYCGGEIRLVDRAYLNLLNDRTSHTRPLPDALALVATLISELELNVEQARAFTLFANHYARGVHHQLKMYLGGMAGTGKSRVIGAIATFFQRLGVSHQLLLLAPTGTAAANIGGYTYHAALGLNHLRPLARSLSNPVRSLLEQVRYIIIDEVSMLSCLDVYTISAVLSMVHSQHTQPFGGFNMMFAGDFAQLPPVAGRKLYDSSVGVAGSRPDQQKSALGKALWLQITQVVILRTNMRQAASSGADDAFRLALTNMRYKQCTNADIDFLMSRVAGLGDARVDDWSYRHVSVITGVNAHRDAINALGCEKFALDTNQELTTFYSVDSVADGEEDNWGAPKKRGAKKWLTTLRSTTREMLWGLTHHATSNLPGTLRLCKGMPVIIRRNYATECGVTNGSEGIVVNWVASPIADSKQTLDVVFVQLTAANVHVQVEGLPLNVVPICAEVATVKCMLDDDTTISIRRKQVHILPNFAMTDYASQGKTRVYNVVDLHNLLSYHGYYTALSRSSFAAKMLIIQQFDPRKIQGGLPLDLKTEFRDLELLDDITRLEYEGLLPLSVTSELRYPRISQFLHVHGPKYRPPHLHPALQWPDEYTRQLIARDESVTPDTRETPRRVAEQSQAKSVVPAVPRNPASDAPIGFPWDPVNFSCAYDSFFTSIFHCWLQRPPEVTTYLRQTSYAAALLSASFGLYQDEGMPFSNIRDIVRRALNAQDPEKFPSGQKGCRIYDVASAVINSSAPDWVFTLKCSNCARVLPPRATRSTVLILQTVVGMNADLNACFLSTDPKHKCCGFYEPEEVHVVSAPYFLTVYTQAPEIVPVEVELTLGSVKWRLSSCMYHGNSHYITRRIDPDGSVWIHDGLRRNGSGVLERRVLDSSADSFWCRAKSGDGEYTLAMLLYTKVV